MKARKPRPLEADIKKRFFQALNKLIELGRIGGLQNFTDEYGLMKAKYSEMRTALHDPSRPTKYRVVDIDAPAYLVRDYGISGDWMFIGRGEMFRADHDNVTKITKIKASEEMKLAFK